MFTRVPSRLTAVKVYRLYAHDVMAAIFVFQNNETAAILVYQTNPVGVWFQEICMAAGHVSTYVLFVGLTRWNANR